MIEALEIDPFDSNHWLYGTGLTIMGGHDLLSWDTVYNVSISTLANGIEEMAVNDLASVPGGSELLVAVGDDSGFTYVSSSNLLTAPANLWMTPEFTTTVSVDYAGLSVADIVRAGNTAGTNQIGVSSNGGVSWRYVHPVTSIFVLLISSRGMAFAFFQLEASHHKGLADFCLQQHRLWIEYFRIRWSSCLLCQR
jgi:xyloglucan-specific exo-beta-1,4-glucanase